MPGRLVMNVTQPSPRSGLPDQHLVKTQHGLPFGSPQAETKASSHDQLHLSPPKPNGIGAEPTAPNGPLHDHVASMPAVPPELQHWSDSYVPFQQILQRVAQDTFHDLNQHIDRLAEVSLAPQQAQADGLAVQPSSDDDKESIAKKLSLIKFANNHKDRFVKALVLTEWARDMDQMDRLIELTMWLRQQEDLAMAAVNGIVGLKQAMAAAKMPNPNIDGALHILSTAKAPWMPDLGYIPAKPLSARNLLKTFKDIEFILFTRLNLHENIPPQLGDFHIANGRATFVVKDQFELDIATADDDPHSPLYFVDLRLLLPQSTPIADGPLREHLESTVNRILVAGGLRACYDYLHDYLLTYRISKLRSQAHQLAARKWHGELHVQQVHRSLILQYWVSASGPGSKHWVEVGITSEQSHLVRSQARGQGQARGRGSGLSCRWFRNGQEVKDHSLDRKLCQDGNMTAEALLDCVVAQHSSGRLVEISKILAQWAEGSTTYEQDLTTSDCIPARCRLTARLHPTSGHVRVTIQSVTGRYALSPAGSGDSSPKTDYFAQIASVIRDAMYSEFLRPLLERARSIGWKPQNATFTPGAASAQAQSQAFAIPSLGAAWTLTVSVDLKQIDWYIVHVQYAKARPVVLEQTLLVSSLWGQGVPRERRQLVGLENHAVARTSITKLVNELRAADIAFDVQPRPLAEPSARGSSTVVIVQAVQLLGADQDGIAPSWTRNMLEVKFVGMVNRGDASMASHVLTGVLSDMARRRLVQHITQDACRNCGFDFSDNGVWQLRVDMPLGEKLLTRLISRLNAIQRMFTYVASCRRHRFVIKTATLDHFAFRYAPKLPLVAEIDGCEAEPDAGDGPIRACELRLTTDEDEDAAELSKSRVGNPHARLIEHLRAKLNGGTVLFNHDNGQHSRHFDQFCQALRFTLPLMQTLCAIEANGPPGRVLFNCHTATSFRLSYRAPLDEYTFAISSRFKDDKCFWLVQERRRRQGQNESINSKLSETWAARGQDWIGLRNGAAAEVTGVEDLLYRIDRLVRRQEEAAA